MILHIVTDDKFIDMAYNIFEKASPNNNEFMVVTDINKFKYIKTTPITKIKKQNILSKRFAKELTKYDFVVLHKLNDIGKKLVLNSNKKVKFLWIGWGFDYYCYLEIDLLLNQTLQLQNKLVNKNKFDWKKTFKYIKDFIKYNTIYKGTQQIHEVFNRIDYFAPVLYEDYLLVDQQFKNFHPKYSDWNYGTLEDDLVKQNLTISGINILLGNSATFENNHIEAIDAISSLDLENRKVICPLSYGDEVYANEIINYGINKLANKFESLREFMNIEEYHKIISTCSIVVMNHLRQNAVGNIVTMMYFGAKIFLNKKNPAYAFFKNNGAIIFIMEDINNDSLKTILTDSEKNINREVLKRYWSKNVMLEKTKVLIDTMMDK